MHGEWKQFLADAGAEFDEGGDSVKHFGTPEREASMALTGNVFADLSHLGLISVQGTDARDFLQAQLTSDVGQVSADTTRLAGLCDARGRLLAIVRLIAMGNIVYLSLPRALVSKTIEHLKKYVLRAKVSLDDASDHFVRLGVAGTGAASELAAAAGTTIPDAANTCTAAGKTLIIALPDPRPRFEVLTDEATARRWWDRLNVQCAPVGEDAWHLLDHHAGLPLLHPATVGMFIPQTMNLELVQGVDFRKGCYPGQEVIARLQHRSAAKRRMVRVRVGTDQRPQPGAPVFGAASAGQPVGHVADARPDADQGYSLLIVVRTTNITEDALHLEDSEGPALTLQTLPYAIPGTTGGDPD